MFEQYLFFSLHNFLQEGFADLNLPPVLLGTYRSSSSRKTILFYGHVDVYPAFKSDGWFSEPFDLTERGDQLIGRGVSDNKGPILVWINAINAYRDTGMELPVNIKVRTKYYSKYNCNFNFS